VLEIRSVNHKFCDVFVKCPSRFSALEFPLVHFIKKNIQRGKVDVWLGEEKGKKFQFNSSRLKAYYTFLKQVKKDLDLSEPITLQHLQNGAPYWMNFEEDVEKEWPALEKIVQDALKDLAAMRAKEGKHLVLEIQKRLKNIEGLHQKVLKKADDFPKLAKQKLEKRITQLVAGGDSSLDPVKLTNEVVYLADRADITEELARLSSHFKKMKDMMKSAEPVGRPLDFLLQEMNREWNTIASKSQDSILAHWVVEAKSEMEKIREQIQNIE